MDKYETRSTFSFVGIFVNILFFIGLMALLGSCVSLFD